MSDLRAEAEPSRVTLAAKVIRKDGSIEDLGTIAYYHKNPAKRLVWRVFHKAL